MYYFQNDGELCKKEDLPVKDKISLESFSLDVKSTSKAKSVLKDVFSLLGSMEKNKKVKGEQ